MIYSKRSKNFTVARLGIAVKCLMPISVTKNFEPFVESVPANVEITFHGISNISLPPGKQAFRDERMAVYDCGNHYVRLYHRHGGDFDADLTKIYAMSFYNWETGKGTVQYTEGGRDAFSNTRDCFSRIGFEDILMSRDRLILHASLIETPLGGILFSGVSGVGKSTQADLWHETEGSLILNGDRPILTNVSGQWKAYGSPFAGSSQYYVNRGVPIWAVIMLEQGSECRIRRIGGAEAFCSLFAETTLNDWNMRYVNRACDLLEDLIRHVPIYHYQCTPDENAVRVLKKELTKGGE